MLGKYKKDQQIKNFYKLISNITEEKDNLYKRLKELIHLHENTVDRSDKLIVSDWIVQCQVQLELIDRILTM